MNRNAKLVNSTQALEFKSKSASIKSEAHAKTMSAQDVDPQFDPLRVCPIGDAHSAKKVKSTPREAGTASRWDRNKKKDHTLPREQVMDMATTEARGVTQPGCWAFGMQGPTNEKRQFVFPLTEMGNAQMFVNMFRGLVFYVFEFGQFIVWDPYRKKWLREENGGRVQLSRLIKRFIMARYAEARSKNYLHTINDEALSQDDVLKWAKASSKRSLIMAMLNLVKNMPRVCIFQSALDADKRKLGSDNGVLDLVTGTLEENKPGYLITRYARAAFNPEAEAPAFMKYIHEVCMGQQDLVDFVQEALGYALSGLTKERVFFILLGAGTNGKSTLVETFYHLMGDYARSMPSHAFIKSESRAIRNDLARLPGIRFAPCAEVNTGKYLDESLVKRVTGNDVITARFIGKEFFDFHIIAKFFYSVNTLPRVIGADNAIYNRLIVLPFDGNFEKTRTAAWEKSSNPKSTASSLGL